ncbi:MAG: alpha-L-arabinofuranosidase [Lachnospiraceae bacterium]|nr:alpha-L-arabinofuranosidase [Lachnospiraceae bacterium]
MELYVSSKRGVDIQEDLIGIFFEDINYGADGGLYAEMIENRSFEFMDSRGKKNDYYQIYDGLYGWKGYPNAISPELTIQEDNPQNNINTHYLHVELQQGEGIANKAYDGLYLEEGKKYHVSFWARCDRATRLQVVAIDCASAGDEANQSSNQIQVLGRIAIDGEEWKQYKLEVTPLITVEKALFGILAEDTCSFDIDTVSMMPEDAVCGLFRKDLAEKLEELSPAFIRFPGGCVIEGNTLANRYQWKHSIGPIEQRKANWNRWAVHNNNEENNYTSEFRYYNQTLGMGYYEYFVLCEYLKAKPLPVVNVGLACQYQSDELVGRDNPEYQQYIQDALDLIEFANGDVSTTWGKVRADMGHPAPFGLEFIGIGNEQWQTEKVDFFERYEDFEKAIHEKYPNMKLIGSAGPTVHTPTYEAAWKFYHERKNKDNFTYAVDEHYYMEPEWFLANTHFYDNYPRDVKVFSGEYAAHDREVQKAELRNNWKCALSEAAFLTGVERNADVVYLASYAPLFARIGYVQWSPDLIWFDDKSCYGTPNFYVQMLYRKYTGTCTVESRLEDGEENKIYHCVSKNEQTGKLYIKLVNASDTEQEIKLHLDEKFSRMKVITMRAELLATNSIDKPMNVAPVKEELQFSETFTVQSQSFVIIELE